MKAQFKITRQSLFVVAFFAILATLISLLFTLLEPFLRSFLWAVILSMVFYPVYYRLFLWVGKRRTLAAVLATPLVMTCLVLPGFYVFSHLGKDVAKAYTLFSNTQWAERSAWVMAKLQNMGLGQLMEKWGFDSAQSQQWIEKALQDISQFILEKMGFIFSHSLELALEFLFVTVALFFFFRDGARYAIKAIELIPLEQDHREKVVGTFSRTVTAVVRAIFLTALLQGFLTGVGLAVFGVPLPIFFGVVTFIISFIPFLGPAFVWIPSMIWLFAQDLTLEGFGLLMWGIVITIVDHVVRPWLIGSHAKLPIFWLFFTTIGGLKVYGFLGIFLGPIILSMGIAILDIYKEVYLNLKKAPVPKKMPVSEVRKT